MYWTFDDRDEYKRKPIAENLISLIDTNVDISPVLIDGNWGTGKTEFSLKMQRLIMAEHPDKKVIYIDAFKEDHCDDPLLSVTAAIAKSLPEPKQKELIKKIIPALKFTGTAALKAGATWLLKQETEKLTEEFQDAIKETTNAAIDGVMEDIIKDHMNAEKNIMALKEKIRELAISNQIIIIVDELDRCRPDFSIAMLEKIKHIFDIENVYFILITNLQQLKASVNHIYGHSVNADSYLDKFIKYTLSLPETFKPDNYRHSHTSLHHWQSLANNSSIHRDSCLLMKDQFEELLRIRPLSLRETETFFRYFTIFQTVSPDKVGNGKVYSWNLTVLTSIYLYCFGDKRAVTDFPLKSSIKSFAETLKAENATPRVADNHEMPHYSYVLYGLLKQGGESDYTVISIDNSDIPYMDEFYEILTERGFNRFKFLDVMKKTFDTFSLA
ncbi:P-loop NTPase fold protein [Cronobacter dublinensis]